MTLRAPWLLLIAFTALRAADFDHDAAPILRARCMPCHSAKTRSGGLSAESRNDLLRGGKSGAAVISGKPLDSLLLTMIASGKMPAGGAKLPATEIDTVRQWIERETAKPPVAERDVQAILSAKCWVCHGRREQKAGLDLRALASLLRGGKSGAAIVPGDPESSLLVKRIAAQQMPPPKLQEQFSVRGLTDDELAKVREWIATGARPDPEVAAEVDAANDTAIKAKDRDFWAFQAPRRATVPAGRHPVDALTPRAPAAEATPGALLRRASFDLTGLPPSPADMAAFQADARPDRYERLIDRLLDSPHYGERWGRHWLDAVGYADSEGGNNSDTPRQNAWRYRDYVVRAFNANKPFDRFLSEQIAGDELFDYRAANPLTEEHLSLMSATGFWRMAPDGTNSTEQNFIPERMDVIAGQIEIFGSAVLGLSVGCARCHDHKYDPLPTRDYYRLVATLTPSYDPYAWLPGEFPCGGVGAACDENNTRYFIPKATREYEEAVAHNRPIEVRLKELERERDALPKEKREPLNEQMRKEREKRRPLPLIRALFEIGPQPPPTRVLLRGDAATPGALVAPGPPSILSAGLKPYRPAPLVHSSGRRLALAQWLTDPAHPLTARVMVNRIWLHHFGSGLVTTPGNFGRMGAAPSNQPLLDWLATEFVRSGWDIKAIHRLIMTSAAYKQRAGEGGFPLRRIDAESLRDAILKISGRLDTKQFGPPEPVKQQPDGEVVAESRRRSLYVVQRRTRPVSLLDTFDLPFMNPNCVQRGQSVVSSQALHLMNSDLVRENARYMAGRIMDAAGDDAAAQIERAYLLALARKPSAEETQAARQALERLAPEWTRKLEADQPAEPVRSRARWLALASLCHTLMNSAEFLYID
ncbi:MAG: DUF1553 domain-containing protein [Acidobacteria bacterium]|nr:DUF1553 domain-containing protein [Acidobacteriota bacterium]